MPTFRSDSSSSTTIEVNLTQTARPNASTVTFRVDWEVNTGSATSLGSSSDRTLYIKRASDNATLTSKKIKDNKTWNNSSTYSGSWSFNYSGITYPAGSVSVYIQSSDEGTQSCIWQDRDYCTNWTEAWTRYNSAPYAPTAGTIYKYNTSTAVADSSWLYDGAKFTWGNIGDAENNLSGYSIIIYAYDHGGAGWQAKTGWTWLGNVSAYNVSRASLLSWGAKAGDAISYGLIAQDADGVQNTASQGTHNFFYLCHNPNVPTSPSVSKTNFIAGETIRVLFGNVNSTSAPTAGYEVAMQDESGAWYNSGAIIASNASASATYVDVATTGWAAGQQWKFFVRAYNVAGVRSDWSTATALIMIGDKPSVPQTVLYNGGTSNLFESPVRVSWSAPATTYGIAYTYEVQLGVWNGSGYTWGSAISTGTTAYYDWNLTSYDRGQRLYIQVRAVNVVGASAWAGNNIALYYNRIPATPTIIFPKSSTTTYNPTPRIGYQYATDADGQSVLGSITLNSITKDANDSYWSRTGRQTAAVQSIVQGWSLTAGSYTVYAKSNDGLANSSQTQRTFTVATPVWTDATITPKSTPVKAVHINELRTAIGNVYAYYGLTAPTWTDTITAGVTPVKAVHILEMRQAIEAIRTYVNSFDNGGTAKDIPAFVWTDAIPTRIKAAHITELRQALTIL